MDKARDDAADADDADGAVRFSPRLTAVAVVLLVAEVAGGLAGAVFFAVETIRDTPESKGGAISLIVMALFIALGLGICVAGLAQHRSWVRGPVITWQLIQGGVAMRLTVLWAWWIGLPLLAVALALGILVSGPWVIAPRERSFA